MGKYIFLNNLQHDLLAIALNLILVTEFQVITVRRHDIENLQRAVVVMGRRGLRLQAEWLKRGDEQERYYKTFFEVTEAKNIG